MAGLGRIGRGVADEIMSRGIGIGIFDDLAEEGVEKFLGKTALNHGAHAVALPASKMLVGARGGLINKANASDAPYIMAGLDTSRVPGGSISDRLAARLEYGAPSVASGTRSGLLGDFTLGMRGVERRLDGSPASLLFPSGLVEYLESVNSEVDRPTMMTRAKAAMDIL